MPREKTKYWTETLERDAQGFTAKVCAQTRDGVVHAQEVRIESLSALLSALDALTENASQYQGDHP